MTHNKYIILGALLTALTCNTSAHARDHWEPGRWRQGHWIHDRHGGRLGWWWVVGPSWYFYPRPVFAPVPQTVIVEGAPQPPVTVIQQPAPPPPPPAVVAQPPVVVEQAPAPVVQQPVLYYCKATGTYYPETMSCPGGWSPHVAGTPPTP